MKGKKYIDRIALIRDGVKFARKNYSKVKLSEPAAKKFMEGLLTYKAVGGVATPDKIKYVLRKTRELAYRNKDKKINPYKAQVKILESFTGIKKY